MSKCVKTYDTIKIQKLIKAYIRNVETTRESLNLKNFLELGSPAIFIVRVVQTKFLSCLIFWCFFTRGVNKEFKYHNIFEGRGNIYKPSVLRTLQHFFISCLWNCFEEVNISFCWTNISRVYNEPNFLYYFSSKSFRTS